MLVHSTGGDTMLKQLACWLHGWIYVKKL